MEQHRTRQPQRRQRPRPPLARQDAVAESVGVYRVQAAPRRVPPVVVRLRRLPNPRFTGLGAGLFAVSAMLVVAFLDELLLDGAPLAYGLLFLPVSALTALWVRTADLVTAPISVPIAFAVGTIPITGGSGFVGHTMALVTALAVHAGWLYGGTLVAGLIASVRKVRQMSRRLRAPNTATTFTTATTRTGAAAARPPAPRSAAPRAVRRG
ncbi:DUF6542 domain-containing protein [Streptomyces sp. AK02-01A]|uniref:DUF6542 domain-containing protein n=1 Tax=Streptomyces sp. AK02-01A TaxID=3028648 RepID=UPI0029B3BE87|nr:DUF6542 domain-containing protein [Streptomyces sp. AK02-01A]MDX3851621.1 hypothetical protein [Streptomyces sp. AK02-01A]